MMTSHYAILLKNLNVKTYIINIHITPVYLKGGGEEKWKVKELYFIIIIIYRNVSAHDAFYIIFQSRERFEQMSRQLSSDSCTEIYET